MKIGIPKENHEGENRVALSPQSIKKLTKLGFQILVEKGAGEKAFFLNEFYEKEGALILSKEEVFKADIIFKINRPNPDEINLLHEGSSLFSLLEAYHSQETIKHLAKQGVLAFALENVPRISRAQSMDVLSSQANIAGYRAVLEAANHYGHFLPMMMTSGGMAKPAKVIILGAGVAGLQAIATARRLGAAIEAYDVRSEVKEEILSLGAKFIEFDLAESGSGKGGYAKELSEENKNRLQSLLTEKLSRADIIISTANIPGKKAPILITEQAVRKMQPGSVIIDMAAANGGNCPLTETGQVVTKFDVTLVGITNFPSLLPSDASLFFGNNLISLLSLIIEQKEGVPVLKINLEDQVVDATLVTYKGEVRKGGNSHV